MPRFFINESPSRQAIITGEDSKHITKIFTYEGRRIFSPLQRSR